jgi:hypothetical protein
MLFIRATYKTVSEFDTKLRAVRFIACENTPTPFSVHRSLYKFTDKSKNSSTRNYVVIVIKNAIK